MQYLSAKFIDFSSGTRGDFELFLQVILKQAFLRVLGEKGDPYILKDKNIV